ncbi:hypothetical protein C211_09813 [Stutzerimonas degradans]|nr:hypothetical protein C211_09813 [Stutzerimonas degradans]
MRDYLKARLRHEPHELFGCLFLDSRHRVLAFEVLFHGTIDGASVYPRQVVKRALAQNAAAVILTHNHPSGVAEPSQADRQLTQRLKEALALIDVRVLDHFIVGEGGGGGGAAVDGRSGLDVSAVTPAAAPAAAARAPAARSGRSNRRRCATVTARHVAPASAPRGRRATAASPARSRRAALPPVA